ncbi:MAG: aminopeptidase family protein P, partial [Pseudomonadota bacterium]
GKSSEDKRNDCAAMIAAQGADFAVITLPDSLCWLLNIRGNDVSKTPLVHGFAILGADARVRLFIAEEKIAHFDPDPAIDIFPPDMFESELGKLTGKVICSKTTVPVAIVDALKAGAADVIFGADPCALPKACKNPVEIEGTRAAHLTDAAAMCELLCWLDAQSPGTVSEIDVVTQLENRRRATNALQDISFDTIAGSGPNGAIMHYRVTHETSRILQDGELLVLDSGGQYLNGTTDITRTIAIGSPGKDESRAFTRVLQGMIAISRLRWPKGLAGRDLEAFGRNALWQAGQDFNHGVGHGVGHYLGVHEGPQRFARTGTVPFEPGMILSNEPGYYREGAFGIRIENLVVVKEADRLPSFDPDRTFYDFETLTYVPIDRRLIRADWLTEQERDWLNAYHLDCRTALKDRVADETKLWLEQATRPI